MHKLAFTIVGITWSLAALGQSSFGTFGSGAFSLDTGASLPNLSLPASFIPLAVAPNGPFAIYRTHLPLKAALDAAAAALERDGWSERGTPMPTTFITEGMPLTRSLCRADQVLGVTARDTPDTTEVTYRLLPEAAGSSCGDAWQVDPRLRMQTMQRHMPTLEFPPSRNSRSGGVRPVAGISGGGSGSSYRSSTQVAVDLTTGGLADHLAAQLFQQGWQADSGWSGAQSSGSTWTSQPERDTRLAGMLSVVDLGDATFEVEFRIVLLN